MTFGVEKGRTSVIRARSSARVDALVKMRLGMRRVPVACSMPTACSSYRRRDTEICACGQLRPLNLEEENGAGGVCRGRRTDSATRTYFSKNSNHVSSSTMAVPLRAVTKSIAGCIDLRAAEVFRSGVTYISVGPCKLIYAGGEYTQLARKRKAYRGVSAPSFIGPSERVFDSEGIPVGEVGLRWGEPEHGAAVTSIDNRVRPSVPHTTTCMLQKTHAWIGILGSVRCEASMTTPNADPPPPRSAKNRSWF